MTRPNRKDVQPSFLLYYAGSDNTKKVRILSDDALSGEFTDNQTLPPNFYSPKLEVYQLEDSLLTNWAYEGIPIIGIKANERIGLPSCAISIFPTENSPSWQDYFNQSKQHHWIYLWAIIAMRMSGEDDKNDPLDLELELKREIEPVAVISLDELAVTNLERPLYFLCYDGPDNKFYYRLLGPENITESMYLDDVSNIQSDDLVIATFYISEQDKRSHKNYKIKYPLPEGYKTWDGMFETFTKNHCNMFFNDIKELFEDPELRKVIYIEPDYQKGNDHVVKENDNG